MATVAVTATGEGASKERKEWKKMKVQELRDELSRRGLSTGGLRPSLIERLEKSCHSPPESSHPTRHAQVHSEAVSIPKQDADDVSGDVIVPLQPETAKGDTQEPEEPVAVEKPSSEGKDNGVAAANTGVPLTDLEKKHRRAERFGLALQLTEEEKRLSRAARFGDSSNGSLKPNSPGLGDTKLSEEERRKARAERFGISPRSTAEDEAKKKARIARFGMDTKPVSLEGDKRKARAARFSPTSDQNTSEPNKKLKPEMASNMAST